MNVHFRHIRETLLQKAHTICGVLSNKGNLLIGIAICNPSDQFVKAIGRTVAFSHAHLQPVAELVIPEGEYSGHIYHEFVNNFYYGDTFKNKVSLGEIVFK